MGMGITRYSVYSSSDFPDTLTIHHSPLPSGAYRHSGNIGFICKNVPKIPKLNPIIPLSFFLSS